MAGLTIPMEQRPILDKICAIPEDAVQDFIANLERPSSIISSTLGVSCEEAEEIRNAVVELYKVRKYFDMETPEFVEAVAQKMQETESLPLDQVASFKERLTKLLEIHSGAPTRSPNSRSTGREKNNNSLAQHLAGAGPFQERFIELTKRWRSEVRTVSSTTERVLNSAYQDIIGMGRPVLPLIFRELEVNGGHWFWALRHITQENPASPEDAGNIQKITDAWLRWGREHHYL